MEEQFLRLLVIEDDAFMAALVSDIATEAGYDVEVVSDRSSLAAALDRAWTLILLDLIMPELDPVSIIWTIAERRPGTRVAIFSEAGTSRVHAIATVAQENGLAVVGAFSKRQHLAELRHKLEELASPQDNASSSS